MATPILDRAEPRASMRETFVHRVRIRNYKSIGTCDVHLGPLAILVGRNGSGKSNFLDALRFIAESLQTSLDHAIKWRGGIDAVRRRSTGHPHHFAIEIRINLPNTQVASYGFEIGAQPRGGYIVKREHLRIQTASGSLVARYRVEEGKVVQSSETMPPAGADRLYLVNAAGLPQFRVVYDSLSAMGFYNLNPEEMKKLQSPDAGELLHRDGSNIASVMARLGHDEPKVKERIGAYLRAIVPGITEVNRVPLGPSETLEFRQDVEGSLHPWKFYAASMSDGTLRALGILVAVMQLAASKSPVSLVGIEEPETALHPAAAGALMDALREAVTHTQIVVTTHNPELLDQIDTETDTLLAVQAIRGTTEVGPVDSASRQMIKEHLLPAGELLRMDQLGIDASDLERQKQMSLFQEDGEAP